MALLVVLFVGMVLAQTWYDWRAAHRSSAASAWAGGLAIGGLFAAALATGISLFEQKTAGEWAAHSAGSLFWLQLIFVLAAMSIVVFAVRKKRARIIVALAAVLLVALCLSLAFLV